VRGGAGTVMKRRSETTEGMSMTLPPHDFHVPFCVPCSVTKEPVLFPCVGSWRGKGCGGHAAGGTSMTMIALPSPRSAMALGALTTESGS